MSLSALGACLFAAASGPGTARAQPAVPPGAAAVKADYLYKFLGYVSWPAAAYATPDAPHVVGVINADDVLVELEQLATRVAPPGNRRLVVRRLRPDEPPAGVHLLHIGRGARPADPATLRSLPVLVVTDAPTGLTDYAMLNFVTVDHRVRFEAAPGAAERAGLKLSARLLAVAARVIAP